jgi:hypothetical protein
MKNYKRASISFLWLNNKLRGGRRSGSPLFPIKFLALKTSALSNIINTVHLSWSYYQFILSERYDSMSSETLAKFLYIAQQEDWIANKQIDLLVNYYISEFEKENGRIEINHAETSPC